MIKQQQQQFSPQPQFSSYATPAYPHLDQGYSLQNATSEESHLYPALTEYMGLKITPEMIAENQLAIPTSNQVSIHKNFQSNLEIYFTFFLNY